MVNGMLPHHFDQAQEQVVILTAIAFRPLSADLLVHLAGKAGQMADVVAAKQIIRGIIRFEMSHLRALHTGFKQCLIAVQERRLGLQDGLSHLINRVRGQQVVVVRQRQIFPFGQFLRCIGVRGNALVLHFCIADPSIFQAQALKVLAHFPMGLVRCIRNAQLPAGAGLRLHAFHQLPQILHGGVVDRNQNADHREVRRILAPLCLQHLLFRQITGLFAKKAAAHKPGPAFHHYGRAFFFGQCNCITGQFFQPFYLPIHSAPFLRLISAQSFQISY